MKLLKAIKGIMDATHEEMMAKMDPDREERKAERKAYLEEMLVNMETDREERKQEIRAGQDHLKEEMKVQMASPVSRMDAQHESRKDGGKPRREGVRGGAPGGLQEASCSEISWRTEKAA
jgi:hypothetical protein